jgi:ABC-2 type transport system permease protein
MPIFFLSGALFPIILLKSVPPLYYLQFINPLTYGIDGIRGALIGTSFLPLWLDFAVILGFALLFLFLGVRAFEKMEID